MVNPRGPQKIEEERAPPQAGRWESGEAIFGDSLAENPSNASSFANKCLCLLFLLSRLHQALQFGKGAADPAYLLDQSLHHRILSYQDSPQIF